MRKPSVAKGPESPRTRAARQAQASNAAISEVRMRIEFDAPDSVTEPRMWVKHQPVIAMALRRGSVEMGLRRSEMKRHTDEKAYIRCGRNETHPSSFGEMASKRRLARFVHRYFGRRASGSLRWNKL